MNDYPLHHKALTYAMNEYHKGVHEIPLGSNRGPRVEHYQSFDFLQGGGYPWCVCFCLASWAEGADHPLPYKGAGAYNYLDWAKGKKWVWPLRHIESGDLIVLNIGAGHMAMYIDKSATVVRTVNGNVSDAVKLEDWRISDIRGCIHIPEDHAIKPVKPPLYVVTTSVNGHQKVILTQRSWNRLQPFLPRVVKNRGWNGFTIRRVR